MPTPDPLQQQRDILRDFRGCGQQRSHAERDALERLKAEIAKAEVAMNTARQHTETEMNKVIGNLKAQRDKRHKSAQSIVDNITVQEKHIQQMWFRNHGYCLACGQKLGLLERVVAGGKCKDCQKPEQKDNRGIFPLKEINAFFDRKKKNNYVDPPLWENNQDGKLTLQQAMEKKKRLVSEANVMFEDSMLEARTNR